jgi:hypothetical protein
MQRPRQAEPGPRGTRPNRNGPAEQQDGLLSAADAQRGLGAFLQQRQAIAVRSQCMAIERIGLAVAALFAIFSREP